MYVKFNGRELDFINIRFFLYICLEYDNREVDFVVVGLRIFVCLKYDESVGFYRYLVFFVYKCI